MSVAGPVNRTGRYALEFFGISKDNANFFSGIQREVVPTLNIASFIAAESLIELSQSTPAVVLGLNSVYTNTSPSVQLLFGVSIFSGGLAVGVSVECRPVLIGATAGAPVAIALGVSDFAGPTEVIFCGGQFFNDPIPLLPGWKIGNYVSTLVGAGPAMQLNMVYAQLPQ
jgi:hypothetical protein